MDIAKKSSHKKSRHWLFKHALAVPTWLLLSVTLGLSSGLLLVVQARFLAHIVHGAFIEGRDTDML